MILGLLSWMAGLGGCAMCGACYDECYPGNPNCGEPTGCWGPRAGSVRAMETLLEETTSTSHSHGQKSSSGFLASESRDSSSANPKSPSARWAQQPKTPSGVPAPSSAGQRPEKMARHPRADQAAFAPPASWQPLPCRKSLSGGDVPTSTQQLGPNGLSSPAPRTRYPPSATPFGNLEGAPGPFSFLNYWLGQPPPTQPGQKKIYSPYCSGDVPFGVPGRYSSGQSSTAMARSTRSVSVDSRKSPGRPVAVGPGLVVSQRSSWGPGSQPVGGSENLPVSSPPSASAQLATPSQRMGQIPPKGPLGGQAGPHQPIARTGSVPPAGVPPEVWAAIPPEDRPTARILSITDRKLQPAANPSEPTSTNSSAATTNSPPSATPIARTEVALGGGGFDLASSGGLQWLPAAPLPPQPAP